MKKKRIGLLALVLILLFSTTALASPKLAKKKVTLKTGNAYVLKLSGNKKSNLREKETSMQKQDRSAMLGTMEMTRLVPKISIPIMASMLIQALYNIVDSIFVSRFDPNGLTAVSLAFPFQMLMIALSTGMGTGINSLVSRRLGERQTKFARQAAWSGLLVEGSGSLLFILHRTHHTQTAQIDELPRHHVEGKQCINKVLRTFVVVEHEILRTKTFGGTSRMNHYVPFSILRLEALQLTSEHRGVRQVERQHIHPLGLQVLAAAGGPHSCPYFISAGVSLLNQETANES